MGSKVHGRQGGGFRYGEVIIIILIGIIVEPKKEKRDVVIEVELFRGAVPVELEDEAVASGPEAC